MPTPSSSKAPTEKKISVVDAVLNALPKEAAAADAAAPKPKVGGKKKTKRTVTKARVCIHAGENNTIVTVTDMNGNVLGWASSGSSGFKGARKATPYAAKVAAEKAFERVAAFGIQSVQVEVKGIGPGREQAIRGLQTSGVSLDAIVDTTAIAHGGCKATKPRRI